MDGPSFFSFPKSGTRKSGSFWISELEDGKNITVVMMVQIEFIE
jgi:hypothetical protein